MKTLYLLRHGQAPWTQGNDFNRALDATGERQAAAIGLRLARAAARPEMIVASPAERTRQTACIVAEALSCPEEHIRYAPEIYAADVWLLARLVQEYPASLNSLLLVGHNPMLAVFAEWLTIECFDRLPACGLLAVGFDAGEWARIDRGRGRLLWRSGDRWQETGI
ncbi:MAG TPA: hypothetical protein DEB25_05805 [Desulfobulbaceae bacterium]|nr:hypothetical protein [Desulfobulbaceae bacterium]